MKNFNTAKFRAVILVMVLCNISVIAQLPAGLKGFKNKLVDKVTESASNKVIQKTTEKADNEVGKDLDKVFGKGGNANEKSDFEQRINSLKSDVEPNAKYSFSSSYTMTMKAEDGKMISDMVYHLSANSNVFAVEMKLNTKGGDMVMVYDLDKKTIFNLMNINGQKKRMAMNASVNNAKQVNVKHEFNFVKTSQSKKILNYDVDAYQSDQNIFWISRTKIPALNKIMKQMSGFGDEKTNNEYLKYPQIAAIIQEGRVVMGFDIISQSGKKMTSEITNINANDSYIVNASEYVKMF